VRKWFLFAILLVAASCGLAVKAPVRWVVYLDIAHAKLQSVAPKRYVVSFVKQASSATAVTTSPFSVARNVSTKSVLMALLQGVKPYSGHVPSLIVSFNHHFIAAELVDVTHSKGTVRLFLKQIGVDSHAVTLNYEGRLAAFVDDARMDFNMSDGFACNQSDGTNWIGCLFDAVDKIFGGHPKNTYCGGYTTYTTQEKINRCAACGRGGIFQCQDEYS
jgi:hypothetical protein